MFSPREALLFALFDSVSGWIFKLVTRRQGSLLKLKTLGGSAVEPCRLLKFKQKMAEIVLYQAS